MTMGESISEMKVNSYNKAIYELFIENQGSKTEAPIKYECYRIKSSCLKRYRCIFMLNKLSIYGIIW